MKIGIVGSGEVARTLGSGFLKHGHEVMLGTHDSDMLADWKKQNPRAAVGSFGDAAAFGELIVLAVKGSAVAGVLSAAGAGNLDGKAVIDATNPIADAPPGNGVLKFFTNLDESLMERSQRAYPGAHFVKAFNSVGSARMVDPKFAAGKPTMFICRSDAAAKRIVTAILDQFGWETADMGGVPCAPLSRCACSGVYRGSFATSGPTRSSCCGHSLTGGGQLLRSEWKRRHTSKPSKSPERSSRTSACVHCNSAACIAQRYSASIEKSRAM